MYELLEALVNLKLDEVRKLVREKNDAGIDPMYIVKELQAGMDIVGVKFKKGDYFLSELIITSKIFQSAMELIEPRLKSGVKEERIGSMVIATLKGDIHDIGKNIVGILLKAARFEIYDLGVDVPTQKLIEKVVEVKPQIVGFSSLITLSFNSMKEAVDKMKEMGLRDNLKVIIGGGVTTEAVRKYVGADAQVVDAIEGVEICKSFVKEIE
jgi:5-methyltetrahydrofolate--homocysteine methyltransferase